MFMAATIETLRASGQEKKFEPEKKAAKWAVVWGIIGAFAGGELLPILGAVTGAKLGVLAGGGITWYQARFPSRTPN